MSTRFADSLITIIDSHVPRRGKDRSEVLRQAVTAANLHWSPEQIATATFDDLYNFSQTGGRPRPLGLVAPGIVRAEAEQIDADHLRHATMQARGDIASARDADDFAATLRLLAFHRTDITITSPGLVDISAYTDAHMYRSGPELAASALLRLLDYVPDANPWKTPLARQFANPANWSVETITREHYETLDRTPSAAAEPSAVELKLRAIADKLISEGAMHSWGGGNADGPTVGLRDNGGLADSHRDYATEGFDAGSLAQYLYKQALGISDLPRTAFTQRERGRKVGVPHPGDLVVPLDLHTDFAAVYLGGGQVLSAESSGEPIRIRPLFDWGKVEVFRIIDHDAAVDERGDLS